MTNWSGNIKKTIEVIIKPYALLGTRLLHAVCGERQAIWAFLVSGFSRGTSLPLSILRTGRLVEGACFHLAHKIDSIHSAGRVD